MELLENLTLRKSVDLAITAEQLGADNYRRLAEEFSERPEIAEIMRRLAADEQDHEMQFRSLLASVPADEDVTPEDERYMYLIAAASTKFFAGDQSVTWDPREIKTPGDALSKALAFEKATVLFYQAIKDILRESEALEAIITAEKQHVVALIKVIMADAEFRGLADRW